MRGVCESRNLAVALTRRARGASYTRNFSAGVGRGRGTSPSRFDDAQEPVFGGSIGHGGPQGGPLRAGFVGRGAPLNQLAGHPGAPIDGVSSSSAGRGFGNPSQGLGRGSDFRNHAEDVSRPSLDLSFGGFGRGKPVGNQTEPPEEIFSSDRRASLSDWSKWDGKSSKADTKGAPSASELRLMQDEQSTPLQFPEMPQLHPSQWGQERQTQGASQGQQAVPPSQQPPSSPGRQPIQQPSFTNKAPPLYTSPPAGWQQPAQPPYGDARMPQQPSMQYSGPPPAFQSQASAFQGQQAVPPSQQPPSSPGRQPIQQPSFTDKAPPLYTSPPAGWQHPVQPPYGDARMTQQPSMQYSRPPPGWQQQPGHQSYYEARLQPQPPFQYGPPSTGQYGPPSTGYQQPSQQSFGVPGVGGPQQTSVQYAPPPAGWQQFVQQPFYDPRIQPPLSFQYPPPPSGWQQPGQQPYYDGRVQYMQYPPAPPGWQQPNQQLFDNRVHPPPLGQSPPQPLGGQQPGQHPYYNASFQPQPPMQYSPPQTDMQPPGSDAASQTAASQQWQPPASSPSSPGRQPMQQLDLSDKSTIPVEENSGFGQDAELGANYKETGTTSSSGNVDTVSTSMNEGARSFASSRSSERLGGMGMGRGKVLGSSPMETGIGRGTLLGRALETGMGRGKSADNFVGEAGMGRGKQVERFFNFDFSGGLNSGDQGTASAKQAIQMDQESKTEVQDEYSETFTPVIQPGLYGFAPEGISVGPGAGRGRAESPPASGIGLDIGPRPQFEVGPDRSGSFYEQRMQAALQQRPPRYAMDSQSLRAAQPEYDYPEEEPDDSLEADEEAADRAMGILEGRLERRMNRFKAFSEGPDNMRRRSSPNVTQSFKWRRQPEELMKVEKVEMTEEERKEEAERLKAVAENETLQELQHTFGQFMKCYGEMAVEPEHELGDFTNPDIEEKPFMPLEEYLEKAKPNIMKTGLIRSEKEWQDMVKDTLRHVPYYEEFVERYGGPGRYTAKQENEDLEEIAATLPADSGRDANAFVRRSLTTLKSNPAMNLQQKQWLLGNIVDEFSQYIVID